MDLFSSGCFKRHAVPQFKQFLYYSYLYYVRPTRTSALRLQKIECKQSMSFYLT